MSEKIAQRREELAIAESNAYARWLGFGVKLGFALLVASFVLYLGGIVPPRIPPDQLPRYWGLPVAEYVTLTGAPTGWRWVMRLREGDYLNFVGVAVLGITTIACYLRVLPLFVLSRERVFVIICIAEIAVLAAAASGMIFSQHA